MDKSLFFWIVYIVAVIISAVLGWLINRVSGQWIVVLVLIGILGWGTFGPILR